MKTEAEYEAHCRALATTWQEQYPRPGVWCRKAAFLHPDRPAVVWRKPHPAEKIDPERCMSILPSWEALSHWMRGYEEACEGLPR